LRREKKKKKKRKRKTREEEEILIGICGLLWEIARTSQARISEELHVSDWLA
jgi:hypothetical protein